MSSDKLRGRKSDVWMYHVLALVGSALYGGSGLWYVWYGVM